jgi:hypothetical protein
MLTMAVCAYWRFAISPFDHLAVDPLPIVMRRIFMALPTGLRDVETVDG